MLKITQKSIFTFFAFGLIFYHVGQVTASLSTQDIRNLTAMALPNCLHHSMVPVGECTFYDPKSGLNVTPEIAHYQPDIVVAAYNQPGEIPWVEMRRKNERILKTILASTFPGHSVGGGHLSTKVGRTEIYFKEAAVYGSPFSLPFAVGEMGRFLCPRANTPGEVHFHSEPDAQAWRMGSTGVSDEAWPLLPATGFVVSGSEDWAGATIAERAAYLATGGQDHLINIPHQANPVSKSCPGPGCETFGLSDNKPNATLWQVLYPHATKSCGAFGEGAIDEALMSVSNTSQEVLLNVWRCYRCCVPGKGIYIGKVSWGGCGR